jgi:hypothetical protein
VDATDPVEQPTASALQPPESTDDNINFKRTTLNKATSSNIITGQRTSPPTTKRARAAGTPEAYQEEEAQDPKSKLRHVIAMVMLVVVMMWHARRSGWVKK